MQKVKRTGVKSFDHELENESFDYFTVDERKKLDKEFCKKTLTKYSLYSWLFVLGIILITVLIAVICLVINSPFKYLVFISALGYIPLFIFLINILKTTKTKYRYFLFINSKLRDEGFNDFYFRSYMPTLCYRLIIKDQLKKYGFKDRYKYLMENFSTKEKITKFVTKESLASLVGDDGDLNNIEFE